MAPIFAIYLVWAFWLVSWWTAALWAGVTVKRAGLADELLYRVLGFVGFILLFGFFSNHYDMVYRFWRTPTGTFGWTLAALVTVGFAFTWWARIQLGTLWSSSVTHKSDHHVVNSGPYAIVRHPIYTGILLAVLATAFAYGTPSSFLGAALAALSFYIKARLEERFLRQELGPQAYGAYAKRVAMLVPFLRWPG